EARHAAERSRRGISAGHLADALDDSEGGMYVWLQCPAEVETGPLSRFMQACLREGVLYVPGSVCYVKEGGVPNNEARLCFGVASHEQLREAVRRLGKAAREVLPTEKIKTRGFALFKG